jgi:hypothetical protein
MPKTITRSIARADFSFEHSPAKIIANRNCPEIKLAGLNTGPFEEGNEYEVQFWIAKELEKAGISHFREEEKLDASKLYKIQWAERVQTVAQIPSLPESFYPKLRRCLTECKEQLAKAPEKTQENEKAKHLARDIVNTRLKKIVLLSSSPAQTEQTLKNLTIEERFLYEQLYSLVQEWRTQILEFEGTTQWPKN